MSYYEPHIIEAANATGFPPEAVQAVDAVYETISRFAGMSVGEIDDAIAEVPVYENNGRKRMNNYHNLPVKLKTKLKEIVRRYGDVGKFFNPDAKRKNFTAFCRRFFEERQQPREYLFNGVITFPEFKFSVNDDRTYTVESHTYGEDAA
jgi:hypothetical protein